jgi:LAO/AO transport system kinase
VPIDLAAIDRIRARDVRSIARALRWVDDRADGHIELLRALYPLTGNAWILGITGTPGAGKSTLVDRLVEGIRKSGRTVGVLAVDPTSPFTGGAILGDRIRMQRHFLDEGVFIRSLATRGHLGGLSRSAADAIHVLDAAGFDVVIVETVGVGQDELEVTRLAHTSIVVSAPGLGDDVQAIKAGLLEVADVFAVNKADRDGADATVRDLEQMIALSKVTASGAISHGHSAASAAAALGPAGGGAWTPPIVRTVAVKGEGVAELLEAAERHRTEFLTTEESRIRRRRRIEHELYAILESTMLDELERRYHAAVVERVDAIEARTDDPYSAAEALFAQMRERDRA